MKQSNIPNNNTVIILVALAIVIHFFSSCMTTRKHLDKAYKKDPVEVAEYTREKFPCIVTASDTTTRIDTLYDFIELACPDYDINDPKRIDTVYKDKPPVNFLIPTRYTGKTRPVIVGLNKYPQTKIITQKVEDSAKIKVMQAQINDCEVQTGTLLNQRNLIGITALLLLGVIIVLLITRKR